MKFGLLLPIFGGIFKILWKHYYQTSSHFMVKNTIKISVDYIIDPFNLRDIWLTWVVCNLRDKGEPIVTLISLHCHWHWHILNCKFRVQRLGSYMSVNADSSRSCLLQSMLSGLAIMPKWGKCKKLCMCAYLWVWESGCHPIFFK